MYTKYSLKRTTVNGWKESCKKKKTAHCANSKKRKTKFDKDIVGSRLAGTAISRKMVIAIATGVTKANDPNILREFGGRLELTEKFTFQRAIAKAVSDHDIPMELVLNLDQTPLSYVSPGKYTFDLKGSKTVSIKGVEKRQITATFTVTASASFLPIQLIFSGKTKRSLPKFDFPKYFDVTFIPNHWSNYEKCVSLFKKIIFPYLKSKKEELGYPKEQYSLIVMDAFKGQDNAAIKKLCLKNDCELVIVPHNVTNKFSSPLIFLSIKKQRRLSLINSTHGTQIVLVSR